jgi:histone H3/H4
MSKDNVKCDPSQPAWFSLLSHRWPALLSRASIPVDLTPSGYFPRCDFSNYVLYDTLEQFHKIVFGQSVIGRYHNKQYSVLTAYSLLAVNMADESVGGSGKAPSRVSSSESTSDISDEEGQVEHLLEEHVNIGASDKIREEIKLYQNKDLGLQIPKAPFLRLAREISTDVCNKLGVPKHFLWSRDAISALHAAAEDHLTVVFCDADLLRAHRGQATLKPDDMLLPPFLKSQGHSKLPTLAAETKRLEKYIRECPENKKLAKVKVVYKSTFQSSVSRKSARHDV